MEFATRCIWTLCASTRALLTVPQLGCESALAGGFHVSYVPDKASSADHNLQTIWPKVARPSSARHHRPATTLVRLRHGPLDPISVFREKLWWGSGLSPRRSASPSFVQRRSECQRSTRVRLIAAVFGIEEDGMSCLRMRAQGSEASTTLRVGQHGNHLGILCLKGQRTRRPCAKRKWPR